MEAAVACDYASLILDSKRESVRLLRIMTIMALAKQGNVGT